MVWVIALFTTDVSTRRVSPVITLLGIRSLHRFGRTGCPPSLNSALPPRVNDTRHYLNSFRGEPAIASLD
jgi:hypothetical protein